MKKKKGKEDFDLNRLATACGGCVLALLLVLCISDVRLLVVWFLSAISGWVFIESLFGGFA